MFFLRVLYIYVAVIHVSDAFERLVPRVFLIPGHLIIVGLFMATDQLSVVSWSFEEIWRSLVDFDAQTNTCKRRKSINCVETIYNLLFVNSESGYQ